METQEDLKLEIGTQEIETLKPAIVKIENIEIQEVGDKHTKKIVCSVKHPDKEELIHISAVKYEKDGKLASIGLWFNKDGEGKIRKGSALAELMQSIKVNTLEELKDKEINTTTDEKGYLCFKAY